MNRELAAALIGPSRAKIDAIDTELVPRLVQLGPRLSALIVPGAALNDVLEAMGQDGVEISKDLNSRILLTNHIGVCKTVAQLATFDAGREEAILDARASQAQDLGGDAEAIRAFFTLVFVDSKQRMQALENGADVFTVELADLYLPSPAQ